MSPKAWSVPLRAIGWLEQSHAYYQGKLTDVVRAKLRHSMEMAWASNCQCGFMGHHVCTLCGRAQPISAINIFLPGRECVFVFPACIHHYIEQHSYCPPPVFWDAVFATQMVVPAEYRAALIRVNGGTIPLPTEEQDPPPSFPLFGSGGGNA